jgi:gamma-Tubulin ring complex non-core subunit mod21
VVLGRDDIAGPLERMLPYILSQEANVEVLTLLLALSENPSDAAEFDERKFQVSKVLEKQITWQEILHDEPLVGDHWNQPDYSGSDEDEDWVYEIKSPTTPEAVPEQRPVEKGHVYVDELSRLSDQFLKAQFWSHRRKYVLYNENYDPEMDFQGPISFNRCF